MKGLFRLLNKNEIKKIIIIGSGPIVIGQACEFDYSGTQGCKALKRLGFEVVLVNSNPATIMTDTSLADVTYIEPLNLVRLTQVIEKERPDALLPNLGGQSGLNLCQELKQAGVLEKYGIRVIGVDLEAIERGEDRIEFKKTMDKLGIETAKSAVAYSVGQAVEIASDLGYPVVVRPAYTMGGTGGGVVYNVEDLRDIVARGLKASIVNQVLIEESVLGWEELELEIVRDKQNNMITVCFIENIDPMGVHTGDSLCCAPMLTISKELQNRLQSYAYSIVEEIGVVGGTNVQFAHDPESDRVVVIEINPRTSRSSALASKATGFPIAMVSAMLACGLNLSDIPCGKFGTLKDYVPEADYVVVKFARFAFDKFKAVEDQLGTQMKAVGEVMSIGKTYKEALQKAVRSLEIGRYGLGFAKDFNQKSKEELIDLLYYPSSERQFIIYEALRKGASVGEIHDITKIKTYFLEQLKQLVELEELLLEYRGRLPDSDLLIKAKKDGFSDKYLSTILKISEAEVRQAREKLDLQESFKPIHVSGSKNSAYYYSTYNDSSKDNKISDNRKVMILGGGPNRIGQGIEFDYCCVHAAISLRKLGFETIIANCNPETVSTDYDTSDKLYFEPLTLEDVISIYKEERPLGVITQFGGQTPLNLASQLQKNGVNLLGTSYKMIDLSEDRDQFRVMMEKLGIPMPQSAMAADTETALEQAEKIGYPVMARPSFVLGGRGMQIIYDSASLTRYMHENRGISKEHPVLIDRFLSNAMEVEADAISDGEDVFIPAIMEHIELAGIHSGDSACVIPSINIPKAHLDTIKLYTGKIARALNVCGLINIQYAIENGVVYVLEANPRASRTVPIVSKVCDINMVGLATEQMLKKYCEKKMKLPVGEPQHFMHHGVKEAVFPFNMFKEVDPLLGPEMRSTGEVLGISKSFGEAFYKAQEATGTVLPTEGTVFVSVNDGDKEDMLGVVRKFADEGFSVLSTGNTYEYIVRSGIKAKKLYKVDEGRPDVIDAIANKEVDIIINTPTGKKSKTWSAEIRKEAIKSNIPYVTTLAAARASIDGIRSAKKGELIQVKSLQEYFEKKV